LQWLKNGFAQGYERNNLVEPHMSMVGSASTGEYHLQIRNVTVRGALFGIKIKI
jgi:hypothetical protein